MRVSEPMGLPIWKVGVEGVIADGLVGKPLVDAPVFVPEGFELSAYGEPTSDDVSKERLMPAARSQPLDLMYRHRSNGSRLKSQRVLRAWSKVGRSHRSASVDDAESEMMRPLIP